MVVETDRKWLTNVIEIKVENIQLNSARDSHTCDWFLEWTRIIYYISCILWNDFRFACLPGSCHIRMWERSPRTHPTRHNMKSISFAQSVNLSTQRLARELIWTNAKNATNAICVAEEEVIIIIMLNEMGENSLAKWTRGDFVEKEK